MKNLALLIAAGFLLVGCSEKSTEPKVEADVKIDTDHAKKEIGSAMDKAGAEIKKDAEIAKDKLEDAGHAIKKDAEIAKDKLTDEKKSSVDVEVKTK